MIKITTALLYGLLFILYISAIIFPAIYFKFLDTRIDVKHRVAYKLFLKLLNYCNDNNIPVHFEEDYFKKNQPKAAGVISYTTNHVENTTYNFNIYIRPKYNVYTIWTLAHEIGHYIAINEYQDDSEIGADVEAEKLIHTFLDKKEAKLFKIELEIFFTDKTINKEGT